MFGLTTTARYKAALDRWERHFRLCTDAVDELQAENHILREALDAIANLDLRRKTMRAVATEALEETAEVPNERG